MFVPEYTIVISQWIRQGLFEYDFFKSEWYAGFFDWRAASRFSSYDAGDNIACCPWLLEDVPCTV